MKYTKSVTSIIQLIVVLLLPFILNLESKAQSTHSTLSGVVIDMDGEPVPDLKLVVKPVEFDSGRQRVPHTHGSTWPKAITNRDGQFTINNIDSKRFRLVVYPELGSGLRIITIRNENVTVQSTAFRAQAPTWFGKPTLSIEPGSELKNVVVRVNKHGMSISGRVLLADGTPLSNTRIYLTTMHRKRITKFLFFSSGGSGGRTSRHVITDAEGYFITFTPREAAEYAVSVQYDGITAVSRWFRLKIGQSKQGIILRLNGLKEHKRNQERNDKVRQDMWVINPDNNHAYKKIECESWENALETAKAENAYLVEIMDDAERQWVESVFRERRLYWIGLRVPSIGEKWKWDNGEPLTHTNWGPSGEPENKTMDSDEIPIALTFSTKKWFAVDTKNPIRPLVKHAILEKDEF